MPETTERNYKAFISYRHRPLDMAVAKKLHKRIERYVIPKDLRKDGEKKLGLVFRDQDELPISNNLTENIRIALDHSEFLIVICTPDTPLSEWVKREITYFTEHHSRDRVLAVLADGEPEQSFPKPLTEVYNEAGELIETIEPLAANIAASSDARRNRLFMTESLRILASLIGCPYDALYRREQRYKMRRMGLIGAGAALIAAAFIGLMINRNAKISEQLRTTQINESKTLAALSKTALRDGDLRGAIENALDALSGRDPSRPYVAQAEKALLNALNPYSRGYETMRYLQSVTQDTEIRKLAASDDGKYFVTADYYGQIRLYETNSGKELWKAQFKGDNYDIPLEMCVLDDGVFVYGTYLKYVYYSLEDGSVLWKSEDDPLHLYSLDPKSGILFCMRQTAWGKPVSAMLVDGKTGETVREFALPDDISTDAEFGALSSDHRYAAAFVHFPEGETKLTVFDFETGNCYSADTIAYHSAAHYEFRFTEKNELAVACCGTDTFVKDESGWEGCWVSLYDPEKNWAKRFQTFLDFGNANRGSYGLIDTDSYIDYFECGSEMIAISSRNRLIALEIADGQIRWQDDLSSYILAAKMYVQDDIMLVLQEGLITMAFSGDGSYSATSMLAYFETNYDLSFAAIAPMEKPRASRYILVPKERNRQASVVGIYDSPILSAIEGGEDISSDGDLFFSPDQSLMASVSVSGQTLHCDLFDLSGDSPPISKDIALPENYSLPLYSCANQVYLMNDGTLLVGDLVIRSDSAQIQFLSLDPLCAPSKKLKNASCVDPEDFSVLTAALDTDKAGEVHLLLFKNGAQENSGEPIDVLLPLKSENAYGFSDYDLEAIGPSDYVVVSTQENYNGDRCYAVYSVKEARWVDCNYFDPSFDETMAMAQTHPWLALQKSNGILSLIDLSSGKEIRQIESGLMAAAVAKMCFFAGDEQLVLFSDQGDLRIYRTSDGAELHRSNYADQNLRFNRTARYEIRTAQALNRLLVFYNYTMYRNPICLMIDLDSYESLGSSMYVAAWLTEQERLIEQIYPNGLYESPLLSVEELQELGEEVLEKGFS